MLYKKGNISWSSLHPELMPRREKHHYFGKKFTIEHRKFLSDVHIGKFRPEEHRLKILHLAKDGFKICFKCEEKLLISMYHKNPRREDGLHQWCKKCRGEKSNQYKEKRNLTRKKFRHKLGISKQYWSELGISHTKEYRKLQRQKRKTLLKGGGELSIRTIQLVYEDNIKKYGTLTCYLCLKPIPFGKDHLEHKTPLSRGGTNEYNNLGIACQRCNCKKHTKTEKEFYNFINKKGI